MSGLPRWVGVAAAALLLLLCLLLVSSLRRETPPTFAPTVFTGAEIDPAAGPVRITLDARDRDRWRKFDLDRARPLADTATRQWDLAVRRHRLLVNGGPGFREEVAVRELADRREGDGRAAAAEPAWETSRVTRGGDSVAPLLDDWYRYRFLAHLLEPRTVRYAIRTSEGRLAILRVLGYYCPGAEPGCLTFEYGLEPAGG